MGIDRVCGQAIAVARVPIGRGARTDGEGSLPKSASKGSKATLWGGFGRCVVQGLPTTHKWKRERRVSSFLIELYCSFRKEASHSLVVKLVTPRDHDGVVTLSGRSRRRAWPVRPAARESPNALTITRCAPPVGITGPRPGSRGGRGREKSVFAMLLAWGDGQRDLR